MTQIAQTVEQAQPIDTKAKATAVSTLQGQLQAAQDQLAAIAADGTQPAPASILEVLGIMTDTQYRAMVEANDASAQDFYTWVHKDTDEKLRNTNDLNPHTTETIDDLFAAWKATL